MDLETSPRALDHNRMDLIQMVITSAHPDRREQVCTIHFSRPGRSSSLESTTHNVFYGDLTRQICECYGEIAMLAGPEEHKIDALMLSDPRWALLDRIASSQHLKSSLRLREFLFYIAECALRDAPGDATEQQIGIRVFGRPPGYNSSEDSIVRTHARLLRQKLALYFAEEGLAEEILVEIPKGHYLPVFHPRSIKQSVVEPGGEPHLVEVHTQPAISSDTVAQPRRLFNSKIFLVVASAVSILIAVSVLIWHPWSSAAATSSAVDTFWRPFFGDNSSLVIYSNAWFAGDSTSGLRYAPPQTSISEAETGAYVDTYTGIGELASVYDLTKLFDSHKANFTLKRSLLVTWDEAKSRNLVFIGSRAENPSLRVLQPTVDFTMETVPGSSGVVNHHPKPGEPALYSRPERPLTDDYAILALSPGVEPGKQILVFSGLTTFGTQAAVEYVCNPETTTDLLKQISGPKGELRPFEAVLHTTIGGGVPLQTRMVTIRVH